MTQTCISCAKFYLKKFDFKASLNKIQKHLTQLKAKLDESVTQQETLKERKIVTGKRLQRAAILISALADEEV